MSCVDKDFPDSVGLTDDSMSSICSDDDYNYENGDGVRDEKGAAGGDKALKVNAKSGAETNMLINSSRNRRRADRSKTWLATTTIISVRCIFVFIYIFSNLENKLTTNSTKAAVATDRTTQNSGNN
jgi:hypothetical protein